MNNSITKEATQIMLVKGIYKLHKDKQFLKIPLIKELAILTYNDMSKNKFFFTNFSKDFLISKGLVYLNSSLRKTIENKIKKNEVNSILDLIVVLFLIDNAEHFSKDSMFQKLNLLL